MTIPIGIGVYPNSDALALLTVLGPPVNGTPLCLVMGKADNQRHYAARILADAGFDVTRRFWVEDNAAVDWNAAPESEAHRWFGLILGGLNPADFRRIYKRTVGPNEYVGGDPARFWWANAFEVELCRLCHAANIPYAWGSVAVGNIDPIPFATTFAPINAIADSICYHLYLKPNVRALETEAEPYWAWRPWAWFCECRTRGVRFPALFGGESGTYFPWTGMGLGQDAYIAICGQISGLLALLRARGVPILGHCVFGYGIEGAMGKEWNLDSAGLQQIATFNRTATDTRIDVTTPASKPPVVTPPTKPPPARKPMADFDSPNHGGILTAMRGWVIHSTRSGQNITLQQEYDSTARYFRDPAPTNPNTGQPDPNLAVSAHAVTGPNLNGQRQIDRPVRRNLEAWHARYYNAHHRGIEIVQPHHGDAIDPDAFDSAAFVIAEDWVTDLRAGVIWPLQWDVNYGLAEHWEIPPGIVDGKTDIQAPFDRGAFLRRINFYVKQLQGVRDLTDQQKKAILDDFDFLWAYTRADQTKKDPVEAEKVCHERIVAVKQTLGIN